MAEGVVWDLTSYFPSFGGPEFKAFKDRLASDVDALRTRSAELGTLTDGTAGGWEQWLLDFEDATVRLGHVRSYVECLEAADTGSEAYALEGAQLAALAAEMEKAEGNLLQAIKTVPDSFYRQILDRKRLAPIRYYLLKRKEKAGFTMGPEEETLASDLGVDGLHAWGRLYNKVSGQLEFDMTYPDGRTERLPISRWRALMADPDRKIGRLAFEGGNQAWETVSEVCATALNALAGTRLTLNRHRKIGNVLDPALRQSGIRQASLDAMYQAIYRHLDIPRDIFRAKAAFSGRDGIEFFEREAPLPLESAANYTWESGASMIERAFRSAYPQLGDYFRSILEKRWVESESRGSKRPGAFCTDSTLTNEQRIFMTFNGSLNDITTLAHEAGHGWHSRLMADLRPLARHYPMTLAETASIFAEQVLAEGVYRDASVSDAEKLLMLDADLCGGAVLLLDITVRFEFEKAFHEERTGGEVPVSRLKELMTTAQKKVFGDALLDGGEDPFFWASKLHFYISELTFYNFPYTFGFLLARFIVDGFRREGDAFLPRYESFLRSSGSATVEEAVHSALGEDTTDPEFWETAIRTLEDPLKQYRESLKRLR